MKLTRPSTLSFLYAFITIYLCPRVAPRLVNATIDDQKGDSLTGLVPVFWPEAGSTVPVLWETQTCGGCRIKPGIAEVFDGTYTAATYHPDMESMGINMQFTGSAIYVFFTLPNFQGTGITVLTNANFSIDSKPMGSYTDTPDVTTTEFKYNALVFSYTGLSNTLHVLNITTTGSVDAYVNFDYAVYTHDDGVPVPSSTTTTATATTSTQKSSTAMMASTQISSSSNIAQQNTIGSAVHQSPTSSTLQQSPTKNTGQQGNTATTSPRTPVGAIVGGTAGFIAVIAVIISLLLCRHRRGGDAIRTGPGPLITVFHVGANRSAVVASRKVHAKAPVYSEASMVTHQLASQTGSKSGYGAGPSPQNKLRALLGNQNATDSSEWSSHGDSQVSHQNTQEPTQEEIRRQRQEELNNRLKMVLQEMEQVIAGSGEQRTLAVTGREADFSASDMGTVIRLMREQIQLLREQRSSAWAQGLSDEPPPGYMPMETRTRNSREQSS